jgi:hypothetical protein
MNWEWSKMNLKDFNKTIKTWKQDIMKINKDGQNYVKE